ncbi:hypothetical protein KIN20_034583 [Parelaphostrongylus tenuis]|uniref:Neurotransmitter-gated ion-channel ligand-binding domain-containing protein n=1 Tax=Parelaphostrongylus tenuis TaxID=148309 RepID=A0AAD5RCS6_PARTN|nr:hypothetical protein KIN20_034583 [Parelaphostrongylus tenuis]
MATRTHSPLVVLVLLIFSPVHSFDSDCKWKTNVTDVTDIAHHKYQVLEECLFYKLTKDADQMQGKSNALMLLPPTVAAGETLDVQVLHAAVRHMWMNEVFKEMNINGYLKLSWKDRRLHINSDKHQTAQQSSDYVTFQSLSSNNNGNVTGRLEFRIQAHCEIDYTEYPSDIKHCCFNLQSTLYKRYIKYYLENADDHLDISQLKTNWKIVDSWLKKKTQDGDNKAETLEICVTARRRSTTLAVELTMPVLISALLLLIAPFFGKLDQQIKVKYKTPHLGFGSTLPKIYVFYAFTLAVTVISLIMTVLISATSRIKRKVPPAHRFTLLASVVNANLCCGSEGEPVTDGTSSKDASADWLQIHVAMNNLTSCITVIVYVIGAIAIVF